jgi:hypothetical protein
MNTDDDDVPEWWQPYTAEFPRWHAWRGVTGLYYARLLNSSPPLSCSAADAAALAGHVRSVPLPWWCRA